MVSTHSRPKAAGFAILFKGIVRCVSTHSRPKAAGRSAGSKTPELIVSTHSRPKAAGFGCIRLSLPLPRFNTQPPEGGWFYFRGVPSIHFRFQHTAARRRLESCISLILQSLVGFNTQPPEGGWKIKDKIAKNPTSFNTQPPEGGWQFQPQTANEYHCFNTQPPEGGWTAVSMRPAKDISFNTQPPEGGWLFAIETAMRAGVSTHSRPKAAGRRSVCAPQKT